MNFIKEKIAVRSNSNSRFIIFFFTVLSLFLFIKEISPQKFFANKLFYEKGIRLLNDNHDLETFAYYGLWARDSFFPYTLGPIDMPQTAVLFFGFLWFFVSSVPGYLIIFSSAMVIISTAIFSIFLQFILEQNDQSRWRVLVWFNPLIFFFYINRFDMLVVFLLFISIFLIKKDFLFMGGLFFSLSILTKWFPALCFFPLALFIAEKKNFKHSLHFLLGLTISMFIIFLITWLGSGWEGVMMPYRGQGGGINKESIYYLLMPFLGSGKGIYRLFLILQILPAITFPFMVKCYDDKSLFTLITIIIINFILFCPVNSPQWTLWFFPFLLLVIKSRRWIPIIILIQIFTYLYFPLFHDMFGPDHLAFKVVIILRIAMLILVELILIKTLFFSNFSLNKQAQIPNPNSLALF